MQKTTKIVLSIIGVILIGVVFFLYSAFNGLPWKKLIIGNEIHHYLEEKYNEEFVIEERIFNFKDGSYGIKVHPKKDKHLSFITEEGYGDYPYIDYYPEALWTRQVKEDYQEMITELFPEHADFDTASVTGVGMEYSQNGKIPNYKETNELFYLFVRFEEPLEKNEDLFQRIYTVIEKIQDEHNRMELSYVMDVDEQDLSDPLPDSIFFTEKEISLIKTVVDVEEYASKDVWY